MNKYHYKCLRCRRALTATANDKPIMCDLCGSADIQIVKTEKYIEDKIDLQKSFIKKNEIFKKAYRKAFHDQI